MITLHSHFSRFFGMISNYGSGGAQTFSLSLFPIPSSDQPNDHFGEYVIFIHVYVLKCMSVTITRVMKVHVTLQSTINGKKLAMVFRACSSSLDFWVFSIVYQDVDARI